MTVRRAYVDSRYGQLHVRIRGEGLGRPLLCLHATAYSGRTFDPLLERLGTHRRTIAIDTPGYGASDGPAMPGAFADYADAIGDALPSLVGEDGPADLLGYHTGAVIGADLAGRRPGSIDRLVLIGIPFFEGDEHALWRRKLVHRHDLTEAFDQFAARWDYFVTHRTPGLSLARAFECFVDELAVHPRDWWAHQALFDADVRSILERVDRPVLVINPLSPLADASRRAARAMADARVVEMPSLAGAIFDLNTEALATAIESFLARA